MSISVNTSSAHYDYCAMQVLDSVSKSLESVQEGHAMSLDAAEAYVNSSEHKTFSSRKGEFPELKIVVYRRALAHLAHHDIQSRINSLTVEEREVYTNLLNRSVALSRENDSYFPTRKVVQRIAKVADNEIPRGLPAEKEDAVVRNSLLVRSLVYDYFKDNDYYFFNNRPATGRDASFTHLRSLPVIYCKIKELFDKARVKVAGRPELTEGEVKSIVAPNPEKYQIFGKDSNYIGIRNFLVIDKDVVMSTIPSNLRVQQSQLTVLQREYYVKLFENLIWWEVYHNVAEFTLNISEMVAKVEDIKLLDEFEQEDVKKAETYLKAFYVSKLLNSFILGHIAEYKVGDSDDGDSSTTSAETVSTPSFSSEDSEDNNKKGLYPKPTRFSDKLQKWVFEGKNETLFFDDLDKDKLLRLCKIGTKQTYQMRNLSLDQWVNIKKKKYNRIRQGSPSRSCVVL